MAIDISTEKTKDAKSLRVSASENGLGNITTTVVPITGCQLKLR